MNGTELFLHTLVEVKKLKEDDAKLVMEFYKKIRVLKIDSIGQVSVKHGAFLDDDVLKDAIKAAKVEAAKKKIKKAA